MIWRFTAGGQGAAAWRIFLTLLRSKSRHGASRMRMKLAGTMCDVVTRSRSMSSRHDSAVKRGITTTEPPSPRLICAYRAGRSVVRRPAEQVHVGAGEAPERGERVRRV